MVGKKNELEGHVQGPKCHLFSFKDNMYTENFDLYKMVNLYKTRQYVKRKFRLPINTYLHKPEFMPSLLAM